MNGKKKKIVIAGAGFAGLAAANYLFKRERELNGYETILVDAKKTFDFLPLAPDVLAGWLNPKAAVIDLEWFARKRRIEFINESVEELDPLNSIIRLNGSQLSYDFAIIAVGGKVNFFGRQDLEERCLKLNSIIGASEIKQKLREKAKILPNLNLVVTGGGYTGLEAAMNARFFTLSNRLNVNIILIENQADILFGVPERIRKIAETELKKKKIEIITRDTVSLYTQDSITLKSGKKIENALCIWSAGVHAQPFLSKLGTETVKGRIKVDARLNIQGKNYQNLFLAGDCCSFSDKKTGKDLRMAVIFSIGQGKLAAKNVLNSIKGSPLSEYKPVDLGYLIPLTYGKAPGIVFGHNVGSRTGFFLHYLVCVYRSALSKKFQILKDLILKRLLKFGKGER